LRKKIENPAGVAKLPAAFFNILNKKGTTELPCRSGEVRREKIEKMVIMKKNYGIRLIVLLFSILIFPNCKKESENVGSSTATKGTITVLTPKTGDKYGVGEIIDITWSDDISESVNVYLLKGYTTVKTIASSVSGSSQKWTVPTDIEVGKYKIQITSSVSSTITDTGDEFEITKTTRSPYVGKWNLSSKKSAIINLDTETMSSAAEKSKSNNALKSVNGAPNLAFTKLSKPDYSYNWSDIIVIKTSRLTSLPTDFGDDALSSLDILSVAFSFENIGDMQINSGWTYKVYIDNVEIKSSQYDKVISPQYYAWYYNVTLSNYVPTPGSHTIKVVLDSENIIAESNENDNTYSRSFFVGGPSSVYKSFTFGENRYFIVKGDGTYLYGSFTTNAAKTELILANFGTIQIASIANNQMSFSLTKNKSTNSTITATLEPDKIIKTPMTDFLCSGTWELVSTTSTVARKGQRFVHLYDGTYILEHVDYPGGYYTKIWGYVSEKEFKYGYIENGTFAGNITIEFISDSQLKILDQYNGNKFEYKKI